MLLRCSRRIEFSKLWPALGMKANMPSRECNPTAMDRLKGCKRNGKGNDNKKIQGKAPFKILKKVQVKVSHVCAQISKHDTSVAHHLQVDGKLTEHTHTTLAKVSVSCAYQALPSKVNCQIKPMYVIHAKSCPS